MDNLNETKLLKMANIEQFVVYNGLNMLCGQVILAFGIWFGKILEFEEIKRKLQKSCTYNFR